MSVSETVCCMQCIRSVSVSVTLCRGTRLTCRCLCIRNGLLMPRLMPLPRESDLPADRSVVVVSSRQAAVQVERKERVRQGEREQERGSCRRLIPRSEVTSEAGAREESR